MNIGIYFNDEEANWIKEQEEGVVRRLVQEAMDSKTPLGKNSKIIKEPKQVLKAVSSKGDGKTTCKACGYKLPFYKGKCKYCG